MPQEKPSAEEQEETIKTNATETPPPLKQDKEIIQKGKTLSDILPLHNFNAEEIHKLREDAKAVYDLAKIKADHEVRIFSTQDGAFHSLEYAIDEESFLLIEREQEAYRAEIKKYPYVIKAKMITCFIEDNPISAVAQQNEEDFLALALADLFAWDIDFYTDLRQGDSFKVIFEKKYLQGKFVGYGNILAAEFINQGKKFQAFRYTYSDTKESDYFDYESNSLRKEFLKSPINFARITSRFSASRYHPIRRVFRPHYGVDYAARVGTPVQATAEGTVAFAGWNGASGRMVTIRHKNNYETMYLHLRSYAKGIRKGAQVKGGQEIGYVGSSGESTGPHLDYRIKYRGKYLNPLAQRFKPVKPLRKEYLEDFRREAEKSLFNFEAPQVLSAFISNLVKEYLRPF